MNPPFNWAAIIHLVIFSLITSGCAFHSAQKDGAAAHHDLSVTSVNRNGIRLLQLLQGNAVLCEAQSPNHPSTDVAMEELARLRVKTLFGRDGKQVAVYEIDPETDNSLGEDHLLLFEYVADRKQWRSQTLRLPCVPVGRYFSLAEPVAVSATHLVCRVNGRSRKIAWAELDPE